MMKRKTQVRQEEGRREGALDKAGLDAEKQEMIVGCAKWRGGRRGEKADPNC